jgi:Arc/MetJ family transcription regulator
VYEVYNVKHVYMEAIMRTNIEINDELLEEAFSVSKSKSKKDLIHNALKDYIRLRKRKDLTELAGAIEFTDGYNYKDMRK